jgi:glycosyl transferase family 25
MNVDDDFEYYVINLDRSKKRWQRINKHLQSMSIEAQRVSAVYGADLPDDEIARYYTPYLNQKQFFMPLKPAEIGCFMSHRKVLKSFVDLSDKAYAVILEDDVEFIGDVLEYQHQWLDAVQGEEPVMLKLFSRRQVHGQVVYTHQCRSTIRPHLVPLGTQGAVLNRSAAYQLLNTLSQFGMPVDVAYQHWWQHGVRVLVTVGNHINEISAQLGGSNISNKQNLPLTYKIKRESKRSWFRLKIKLISMFYYMKS